MILKKDCMASTDTGVYRGTQRGMVQVYKGIRYALPPVRELRFRAPVPVPKSNDIIDAQSFSPVAKQPGYLSRHNGDDCLSLNIWRNVKADGSSPVLFYVHGGSFVQGSGRESLYSGTVLARDFNVVVVTINYRLGAFGFLDFSGLDGNYCANPGLLDVVEALKWIHKNIAAFGGDPNKVTAAGESAGGSIVSVLPMLDDAAPLIDRMIMMSGIPTAFSPKKTAEVLVEQFMTKFDIKDSEELRDLTDEQIVKGTNGFMRASDLGVGTFQ
ncbi:MAG: carboxylesterase family protein, partial [Eubacteriales bacterium]|nr:carboxylesterase family protein [Eubacteriales bacterium]